MIAVRLTRGIWFIFCLSVISVNALYEDQVGLWDWKQSYVGKVQFVLPSNQNGQHSLIVGTESSVIASISTRNGSLLWRKSMETSKGLQAIANLEHADTIPGGELLTVTANGHFIRSWNANKGHLNWERRLPDDLIESTNSNSKWLFKADSSSSNLFIARFTQTDSKLIRLNLFVFDYLNNRLIESSNKSIETNLLEGLAIEANCKFVDQKLIICAKLDSLVAFWLNSGKVSVTTHLDINIKSNIVDHQKRIIPFEHTFSSSFTIFGLIVDRFTSMVIKATETKGLELIELFSSTETLTLAHFEIDGQSKPLLFVSEYDKVVKNHFTVRAYEWKDNQFFYPIEALTETFEVKNCPQTVYLESLFVIPLKKSSTRYNYKVAFTSTDAQFILASSNHSTLNWIREEALASVISAEIIDLPLSVLDENIELALESSDSDLVTLFMKRISLQVTEFQLYLRTLFSEPEAVKTLNNFETVQFGYARPEVESGKLLVRDKFGFHKAIVTLTKYGKLVGLDTISGKVIWSLHNFDLASSLFEILHEQNTFNNLKQAKPIPIFIQRTTSHHPFQAIATIVLKNGYLFSFDPINGKVLEKIWLESKPKQVQMLHHVNKDNLRGLLILDQNNQVQTYPKSIYNDVFLSFKNKYFMFVVDSQTGHLSGFSFDMCNAQSHQAQLTWSFNIPISKPGENKLEVHFKSQFEQVHSLGRVLGDRNVLYKYLNPNLVAIVNEEPDLNVTSSELALGAFHTVSIYLIDAVTGQMVYSSIHRRARNAFAVHSENSLVYSFYNEKHRRTEVNAIDLYEGPTMANFTAFSSLNRPFYVQPAIVHHNAFIFPTGITAMSDTKTEQGLTNKNLIIALPYGGVLQLPKAFVDPRRPINPTPEHREEGLLPYVPELMIPAEGMINYNQSVINVNRIVSAPATIESTSLVFIHGLDLFFTRVHPSKTFDILKEDFDHFLIVTVLFGLVLLYYGCKYMSKQKTLRAAWK